MPDHKITIVKNSLERIERFKDEPSARREFNRLVEEAMSDPSVTEIALRDDDGFELGNYRVTEEPDSGEAPVVVGEGGTLSEALVPAEGDIQEESEICWVLTEHVCRDRLVVGQAFTHGTARSFLVVARIEGGTIHAVHMRHSGRDYNLGMFEVDGGTVDLVIPKPGFRPPEWDPSTRPILKGDRVRYINRNAPSEMERFIGQEGTVDTVHTSGVARYVVIFDGTSEGKRCRRTSLELVE